MGQRITLKVISQEELCGRAVRERQAKDRGTILQFKGIDVYTDLFCGGCGALLAAGTPPVEIGSDVLKCPACGALNVSA